MELPSCAVYPNQYPPKNQSREINILVQAANQGLQESPTKKGPHQLAGKSNSKETMGTGIPNL